MKVLAGKNKKAVHDQYKMDLGPSLPPNQSFKKKVKPFQPADDSLDDPQSAEELDETTQATPQQVQAKDASGYSHKKMHQAMDKLEADKTPKGLRNRPTQGNVTPKKKLSMF